MEATIRVGLPGWLAVGRQQSWATALDVTPLVEEWALALLDPVDAMRRAAPAALEQPGWTLCGRATVNAAMMRVIRDAAEDAELEAVIENAVGPGKLRIQGACLLLGLAAVTVLDANIGRASAVVLAGVKKRQEARAEAEAKRERKRSAPASAERPTLGPLQEAKSEPVTRPTLTPMAPDTWGEAVK